MHRTCSHDFTKYIRILCNNKSDIKFKRKTKRVRKILGERYNNEHIIFLSHCLIIMQISLQQHNVFV